MKKSLYFLLVVLTIFDSSCNQTEDIDFSSRIKAGEPVPEGVMDTLLNLYKVPAVSIATIKNAEVDWVKAYGVRKYGEREEVDTSTLFQAASISKPVSAALALRLVDEGLLTLDENVNNKLKSWKVPENEFTVAEKVSLRRLLSHSAGLPMHGVPEFRPKADIPSLVEILDGNWYAATEKVHPFMVPGLEYHYSGGGYIILQLLLTDITGRSFEELMQEYVLKPAGMQSSTYQQPLPKDRWHEAAIGHNLYSVPMDCMWHVLPEQATGGLWTTPTDLAHFMIAIWQSYQGLSDTLLPQYLTKEMLTRQVDNMGLGFYLPTPGVFRFNHTGANTGYRCFAVLSVDVPEGVVIMTNGDSGEALLWKVFNLIAGAYGWLIE